MISIKDSSALVTVLFRFDPQLVDIVVWLTDTYGRTVITCGHRPGDKGVHGTDPCRGIDLRSWVFSNPEQIVEAVNGRWQYDPNRPDMRCAILHDVGSGKHIHLQTHPNTRRIHTA
jgi:hypothetical protein